MFVIANFIGAAASVLDFLLQVLLLLIFINAILSWVRPDPHHPIVQFLERISDTVCNPIRRLFPTALSGIDFAPFIAMLVIWFAKLFIVGSLRDWAIRL